MKYILSTWCEGKKSSRKSQPLIPIEITAPKAATIPRQLSQEIVFNSGSIDEEEQAAVEEWDKEEDDDEEKDTIDYSILTLRSIPYFVQEVLDAIHCRKLLVQYVKKK